jgi:hypothetical protein
MYISYKMDINTNFKQIENRNAQKQLHGYQESWRSWDGVMTINYRGHCVNNEDIGYQEYHRQYMTEYCIR